MNLSRSLRYVPVLGLVAASVSASTTAHAEAPMVWVHVSSPVPVQLQRHDLDRRVWDVACDAPCDRDLPLEDEYRVAYGKKGASGETFRFASRPGGEVTLTVHPPSETAKSAGDALIGVGAVLGVASLVGVIFFGSIAAQKPSQQACSDDQATDGRDGGIACGLGQGLAGGAAILSGVVLLGAGGILAGGFALRADSGGSTKQRLEPDTVAAREPTWTASHVPSTGKPAFVIPLSFSF
jgi:hypothetical protein